MTTRTDQAVFVTGASRGLGRHTAVHLAEQGFRVFGTVRTPEDESTLTRETGGRVTPVRLDVTDPAQVADAVAHVAAEVGDGGLAGLVNNAGIVGMGPIEQTPLEGIEDHFRVNVLGPVAVIKEALPLLRTGGGRIVNISSINGVLPTPFTAAYCASKAALEMLSDALRLELKPWGIPVVVVRPGAFDTDIRSRAVEGWRKDRKTLSEDDRTLYAEAFEVQSKFIAGLDAGAGHPDEVAEAVHRALTDPEPQTKYSVGPEMDTLLGLAKLPDTEREEALGQMLSQVVGAGTG